MKVSNEKFISSKSNVANNLQDLRRSAGRGRLRPDRRGYIMLVNDSDALKRLNSPSNLINKLRSERAQRHSNSAMNVFGVGVAKAPSLPRLFSVPVKEVPPDNPPDNLEQNEETTAPLSAESKEIVPVNPIIGLDEILDNADAKIKLTDAHNRSLDLLVRTVRLMHDKADDIKPERLPALAIAASKIVESIRKERVELGKNTKNRNVHYHFYSPEQKQVNQFEVIDVT